MILESNTARQCTLRYFPLLLAQENIYALVQHLAILSSVVTHSRDGIDNLLQLSQFEWMVNCLDTCMQDSCQATKIESKHHCSRNLKFTAI